MIYCPKCGASTNLINEEGTAHLSCPSCGVVWQKFLEAMANDALWRSIVRREKREIICPKCGYERFPSDEATPRTRCPSCRVDYATPFLEKSRAEGEVAGTRPLISSCQNGTIDRPSSASSALSLSGAIDEVDRKASGRKPLRKHWKRLSLAAVALVLVTGGLFYVNETYQKHVAREVVLHVLKDPESAKFGEFSVVTSDSNMQTACLAVNARNSFGGYVGEQQASLFKINGKWLLAGMAHSSVDHAECKFLLGLIVRSGSISRGFASDKKRLGWSDID